MISTLAQMTRRPPLLPALITSALTLAACGGGAPSKAEFIDKADSICAEASERAEQVAVQGFRDPRHPTGREVVAVLHEVVPIEREAIDRVRELEQPEDATEIDFFLAKADAALDETARIRDPQKAIAALRASDTPRDPFYVANQAARRYGLTDCAE